MSTVMVFPVTLVLSAYLIGSIPFSYLIARIVTRSDIRTLGSGNVGATNVLRNAGKLPGFGALVLDLLKGVTAVGIARILVARPDWPWTMTRHATPFEAATFWIGLAAALAVIGHMFPVWLGFRGGKGVATATGAFLALSPLATGAVFVVFLVVLAVTRYVSLGSMVAAASMPLILRFLIGGTVWMTVFSILIAIAVIAKHHTNIARLVAGEERKFPR